MEVSELTSTLDQLSHAELDALIARATQLRDQRRIEAMENLRKEAEVLGVTLVADGKPKRRGRRPMLDPNEG